MEPTVNPARFNAIRFARAGASEITALADAQDSLGGARLEVLA